MPNQLNFLNVNTQRSEASVPVNIKISTNNSEISTGRAANTLFLKASVASDVSNYPLIDAKKSQAVTSHAFERKFSIGEETVPKVANQNFYPPSQHNSTTQSHALSPLARNLEKKTHFSYQDQS